MHSLAPGSYVKSNSQARKDRLYFDEEHRVTAHSDKEQEAYLSMQRARELHAAGKLDEAIAEMREAVVKLAAADTVAEIISDFRTEQRAIASKLTAEYCVQLEKHADAAGFFQQAVDNYSRLPSEEAEEASRRCAARLLECISELRNHPSDRLQLLIGKYEHQQQLFAAQGGYEVERAHCADHIARICMRRGRYVEAAERFREALHLYYEAGIRACEPEIMMAAGECHFRLAVLAATHWTDFNEARINLTRAINIFAEWEDDLDGVRLRYARAETLLNRLDQT